MTDKRQNSLYVVREFGGYSARQAEVVVIGPFANRKIANLYNKRTKNRCRPKTMHDFMLGTRVTTRPPKDDCTTTHFFNQRPDEQLVWECELELDE